MYQITIIKIFLYLKSILEKFFFIKKYHLKIQVLNHAGNLWDACNLAAVSALRHFHRPEVTVEDDGRVTIHTLDEREPIPTFMKKIPVCLTYAFFFIEDQCYTVMDPTDLEERVSINSDNKNKILIIILYI